MRKLIFKLLLFAFPVSLAAQDCSTMYGYLKEGVTLEYTTYDHKDKVQGTMTQTVSSLRTDADTLIAVFDMKISDEKGKNVMESSFPIKCFNGTIFVDMRSVVPPQSLGTQQASNMEIEVNSSDLSYPPDMKPGQELPDAEMEMKMRMGGMQLMNTKYKITNRKVEAKETVTTAAGTFECIKMSSEMEYNYMGKRTSKSEVWYSPEVGTVKTISYDRKGKVDGRSELTKFNK